MAVKQIRIGWRICEDKWRTF